MDMMEKRWTASEKFRPPLVYLRVSQGKSQDEQMTGRREDRSDGNSRQ